MVTKEEMKNVIANTEKAQEKPVFSVTPEEMRHFKKNAYELPDLIMNKKRQNDKKCGVTWTAGFGIIEEMCQISETNMKRTMNGTIRVTRTFLYKFTIGLHMSLDEANELFALCGGPLRETDPADYICINYLTTKDDLKEFVKQYEEYVEKKLSR